MCSKLKVSCLALAFAAGCSSTAVPDARLPTPPIYDAAQAAADARPADARVATPDARAADAPAAAPDGAAGAADAASGAVDAPLQMPDAAPPSADAQTQAAARVILNELNPNVAAGQDLVELLVTKAGTTSGIAVYQDYTQNRKLLARLPAIEVAVGDLVVVHYKAPVDVVDETTAKDACAAPSCYPRAWDVVGAGDIQSGDNGIGYSYRLIYVLSADETEFLDAVPFMRRQDFGTGKPAAFPADLHYITGTGPAGNPGITFWNTLCTEPCDYDHLANMYAATVDWGGALNTPTGDSIQRQPDGVNQHVVSDWQAGGHPHTFGLPN